MTDTQTPKDILKQKFGYNEFWPNQEEIINTILAGENAIVIMPTGGGKSIVFQIPALILEGLTIVISPLISLMKDQVDALRTNGISAAFYNSTLTEVQKSAIVDQVNNGELKLLYVSPETLLLKSTLSILSSSKISMVAIDEAHCISMWGHDFRAEYTKLKELRNFFPEARIIALTATADKVTREDIIEQLGLEQPKIFIASFDRPNLSLTVAPAQRRFDSIYRFIQERKGQSGIIYCLSRKGTESLANKLQNVGVDATFYHAGMPREAREKAQDDFIHDKVKIVCATIAFGMGIDKSNVRFVIHYNLPKNLEGFYQEIGRAGRDGAKSDTLLYYSFGDVMLLKKFAEESGQAEIQLNKLMRMQQYAEAQTCRRKILLSYFNEYLEDDCGNCDVCNDPPITMDGTIIAQKALSASYRMKENVATGLLIDVLRGSGKREVFDHGYQNIKTFGAGREMAYFEWQQYILQLVHQGLFELDYKDHQKLKITKGGLKVLFEGNKISLVQYKPYEVKKKKARSVKKLTKGERMRNELYAILLKLRATIAEKENIPAYTILTDANIEKMAIDRPGFVDQIKEMPGMSDHKYEKYGLAFLSVIQEFKIENRDKGNTQIVSFLMFKDGKSTQEIANERGLGEFTIYGHLAQAHEWGEDINLMSLISKEELTMILDVINEENKGSSMGELASKFNGNLSYSKIKLGVAEYLLQKRR